MKNTTYSIKIFDNTSLFVLWICQLQAGGLPHVICLRLQLLSIFSSRNAQKCAGRARKDWHNRKKFKSHHKMKTENMPVFCNISFICLFICTFKVHWNCSWHIMANSKQNTRFTLNIIFLIIWASGCQLLFFQLHNWTIFFFFQLMYNCEFSAYYDILNLVHWIMSDHSITCPRSSANEVMIHVPLVPHCKRIPESMWNCIQSPNFQTV